MAGLILPAIVISLLLAFNKVNFMIKLIPSLFLIVLSLNIHGQHFVKDSFKTHIQYLASEQLKGRKAGSYGDSIAADYINKSFGEEMPIDGIEVKNQHFYLVTDVKAGENNKLEFGSKNLIYGKDFQPFSFSSSSTAKGEIVFAGFGITGKSDSLTWDDYQDLDVQNKWVLILRGDPEPDNPSSAFIPLSSDRAKALTAKDKGAIGVLLVSPTSISKSDELIDLSYDKSISDAGIPVLSITRQTAALITQLKGPSIDSLEKRMLDSKASVTFPINDGTLSAKTEIIREKKVSRNVIKKITGTDTVLKDEYIVIGAHYDHLGEGGHGSGSRIPDTTATHPGADDNASGVSSLIELSNFFSKPENRQPRSLLFIAFGAEEMGLVGARYFIDHPSVPLSSIKAMINLDMIGRLKTDEIATVNINGTGTFRQADSILNIHEKNQSFSIKRIMDGYGPSDHAAFYTSGIPVLFLTTGAHGDYHTPEDKEEYINYDGLTEITNLTTDLIKSVAAMPVAPFYTESGIKREPGRYGRNLKVTLGIMPDVTGEETSGGMKVEGTRKDAPAARAGMVKGDIITAINGLKVSNVYDYMSRLGKLKPGETVNVEILRAGKKEILIIQL